MTAKKAAENCRGQLETAEAEEQRQSSRRQQMKVEDTRGQENTAEDVLPAFYWFLLSSGLLTEDRRQTRHRTAEDSRGQQRTAEDSRGQRTRLETAGRRQQRTTGGDSTGQQINKKYQMAAEDG
jgi:hypothetical protein